MKYIYFYISFIFGILTVLFENPGKHYIVKEPNLNDTYIDDNNIPYKYKLKYIE